MARAMILELNVLGVRDSLIESSGPQGPVVEPPAPPLLAARRIFRQTERSQGD